MSDLVPIRTKVMLTFLLFGVLVGSWLARIPAIQADLHLSAGMLGAALMCPALGALAVTGLMPRLSQKFGSAAMTHFSAIGWSITLWLVGAAQNVWILGVLLFWFGVVSGTLNVAMNTQAQVLQERWGRPIMSTFHAMFGVGAMIGSAGGALAAHLQVSTLTHLLVTSAILVIPAWLLTQGLLAIKSDAHQNIRARPKGLIGLSALAVCILIGEGAMADWVGVYLKTVVKTKPATAALGYTVYAVAMTAGRLMGDWLLTLLGAVKLVGFGCLLAAVALTAALLDGGATSAFAAFVCAGLGYAAAYPTITSVAARFSQPRPEAGIAAIAATAYISFLVGPPLIGFIAQFVGLQKALGVVALLNFVGFFLSSRLRSRPAVSA
jgi:fucose permease